MCSVKKKLRTAAIVILLLVFVGSLARVAYQAFQYKEGDEIYSEAEELVNLPDFSDLPALTLPDSSAAASGSTSQEEQAEEVPVYVDPYADALRNMDFSALQEVNSDVLGWILIPDTIISYPIVQGDDNQYYLTHSWKKSYNWLGSDRFVVRLGLRREGVKLIFVEDIYRLPDGVCCARGVVDTICLKDGKLTRGEAFDELLGKWL